MATALIVLAVLACVLGAFLVLGLLARLVRIVRVGHGRCQKCGATGRVIGVHYLQNTGMLVMRQTRQVRAALCRRCSLAIGGRMWAHNLVLGWWGTISMLATPCFLFYDGVQLAASLLVASGASARHALEEQRDYAQVLSETKDEDTVVDVLVRATGASPEEARAFVRSLPRRQSP